MSRSSWWIRAYSSLLDLTQLSFRDAAETVDFHEAHSRDARIISFPGISGEKPQYTECQKLELGIGEKGVE